MQFDEDLMIPDKSLSINAGCIQVMGWQSSSKPGSFTYQLLTALAEEYDFSLDTPYEDLSDEARQVIIYGTDKSVPVHYSGQRGTGVYDIAFEGLIENVNRRYRETSSEYTKKQYEEYMEISPCPVCKGQRLKRESLAVTVDDKNIYELTTMPIRDMVKYFPNINITDQQRKIGGRIIKEIEGRIGFLNDVGLDYLNLSRATGTLSGGEAQRIRLATQIGSGLVGVAYILDEPSIGLHQRDNEKLLSSLKGLRDLGNTLLVVEHDEDTMREADCIVDIGPGAGSHGGDVVAIGTAEEIMKCPESITGQYLSGKKKVVTQVERVEGDVSNVIGLPLPLLDAMLSEFGARLL